MKYATLASVAALLAFAPLHGQSKDVSDPDVATLLERFERAFQPLRKCTFRAEIKVYAPLTGLSPGVPQAERLFQVWCDAEKLKYLLTEVWRYTEKGNLREEKATSEIISRDRDPLTVTLREGSKHPLIITYEGKPPRDVEIGSRSPEFVLALSGTMDLDGVPLPQLLRQGTVKVKRDSGLWVVEGKTPFGLTVVRLDPERGYLPVAAQRLSLAGDRVGGGDNKTFADLDCENASREYQVTKVLKIDGRFVIGAFTLASSFQGKSGERSGARTVVTLSDINLNPNFTTDPFVVQTPIPNGTPVTVADRRGIDYEWRDGRIVKRIDQASVSQLSGNWFTRGVMLGTGLLLLGVVAVVVAGIWCYFRFRRARA
jgi:hypothetical protein